MISVEDMAKAEDETWEAILAFANNTDQNKSCELAEDVSMAIINLTNLCYFRGVEFGKGK